MGLDLLPQNKAKPGREVEWRALLERDFRGDEMSQDDIAQFQAVSVPVYASLGAPQVGFDTAADDWIIAARGAKSEEEKTACLRDYHGYYAVALLGPPGIPRYSNGPISPDFDETSFRGAFLNECEAILAPLGLFHRAWESMWPNEAVIYGRALLTVAEGMQSVDRQPVKRGWRWWRKAAQRERNDLDPREIISAAGAWYVFWGERGHPIKAWY